MKRILFVAIVLFFSAYSSSAQATLIKKMGMFSYFGEFNGKLMFFGTLDSNFIDYELWSTDGTTAGTQLVKDIWPGSNEGVLDEYSWQSRYKPIVYNNEFYFLANDGVHGMEVWKTDGTGNGTVMLKDINPGAGGYFSPYFRWPYFCEVNGILYFTANDGTHGFELWKTDGTETGTVMVKDISSDTYFGSIPAHLFNYNGKLYFGARDDSYGVELFTSDGTAGGTHVVKDIFPGTTGALNDGYGESFDPQFTISGGKLFFVARTDTTGPIYPHLYSTDGTAVGTIPLETNLHNESQFSDLNGTLFFYANDANYSSSYLFKSDGTALGTVNVPTNNAVHAQAAFLVYNNELYFFGDQNNTMAGLCKSDGTTAGTSFVYALPALSSYPEILNYATDPGSPSFFFRGLLAVSNYASDTRMVQSNGTPTGNVIFHGISAYNPAEYLNHKLYFLGRDSSLGFADVGIYEINPVNVGVNEINTDKTFSVYPDPADQFAVCSFQFPTGVTKEISLFDLSGRKILSGKIPSGEKSVNLDVSDLREGIYLLKVEAKNFLVTEKISVMH